MSDGKRDDEAGGERTGGEGTDDDQTNEETGGDESSERAADDATRDDAAKDDATIEATLESEEWYVLTNWLRERENRLQYALRSRSDEWAFVHDLRREVERQRGGDSGTADDAETAGVTETVALTDRQMSYLSSFLRKRARKLLLMPWRDRERRDVVHLRDHLLAAAERGERTDDR